MGTTGLGEGHEKTGTGATWQADGLRDSDVLSSATLTNFVERGLGNGVIPLTMTDYSASCGIQVCSRRVMYLCVTHYICT